MAQSGAVVKVLAKPEASALGEMVNAELSNQIATAKQYPRDEDACLRLLEKLATKSDAIAEQCMYTLKRTQKNKDTGKEEIVFITGPSIHFMQLLNYCWGNMRAAARIVEEGEKTVTAQGIAYDLQRNNGLLVEIKRGITTSKGYRFGQDMINVTSNAACSIAERNAIEDCIPRVLWWDIFEAVKTKAVGAAQIPERLQKAVRFFVSKGAKEPDILAAMGVEAIADMGREHLEIFLGLTTALKEGTIDAAKIFTADGKEQRERLSLVADGDDDPDSYNSIDRQVQGKAAEPAKEDAAQKDGAKAVGDGGVSPKEDGKKTKGSRTKAGSQPQAGADQKDDASRTQQQGGGSEQQPADAKTDTAAADAGSDETDAALVARIETEVKEAKTGKRDKILAARGALTRISETADDQDLRKRAVALLNRYELDDQ
jgi:hypothetical protein